eukprot:3840824-Pyramimonas_sp.AAC.2
MPQEISKTTEQCLGLKQHQEDARKHLHHLGEENYGAVEVGHLSVLRLRPLYEQHRRGCLHSHRG